MLFFGVPVIVSTYEAFSYTVKMDYRTIFLDPEFYEEHTSEIRKALFQNGYSVVGYPTDFGLAFTKNISAHKKHNR